MGFLSELLRLKSYVEAHVYFYLLDRFPKLSNGQDCKLCKSISVAAPFGKINTRDQNGQSYIQPEICVTSKTFGVVAEAAAWDDDSEYGNNQSEAHHAMHQIGLENRSVYFAQKIMCQVFPAYLNCREMATDAYAFISFTENHKLKMENVLSQLKSKQFIQSFDRPLKKNNEDIQRYRQIIYELNFPEPSNKIINRMFYLINGNTEPRH